MAMYTWEWWTSSACLIRKDKNIIGGCVCANC